MASYRLHLGVPFERVTDVMAMAHVDDDQQPAPRIAPDDVHDLLDEVSGVGLPGVPHLAPTQPGA